MKKNLKHLLALCLTLTFIFSLAALRAEGG